MATPFLAVIPARLASTRLPRKPLADIDGMPMVVRVARQAMRSGAQRVVVATDTEEIADVCDVHDVEALLTSAHHTTGTDRLAEVVQQLELDDDAIVVNVQGDEPLIPPNLIRDCASLLGHRADCAIATAAHPLIRADEFADPNIVKVVLDAHDRALYFSRAPIPFERDADGATAQAAWRHIGLYAYRARFLRLFPRLEAPAIETLERLEQLRALYHGHAIAVLRCASAPPGGVDTLDDLERVRATVRRSHENLELTSRPPRHDSQSPNT